MRILVADDDHVNRIFLEKLLSDYGDVTLVDNGITAVETAINQIEQEETFDLILLDVMMTKLDGYKTLEAIREAEYKYEVPEEQRSKVIMISALDEDFTNGIQICSDYDAYICKPIRMDELQQILSSIFSQNKNE